MLGPGLLDKDECGELLAALLPRIERAAVVLDAVALSALGRARSSPARCTAGWS